MMKDLALALSGLSLRKSIKATLLSEGVRERWESGKNQGDSNLERFLSSVDTACRRSTPP
jgi:DNA sulfur modification protein DndD